MNGCACDLHGVSAALPRTQAVTDGPQRPARGVRLSTAAAHAQMEFNAPCRTTKYPREVPPLPWFRQALPQMAMAGARALHCSLLHRCQAHTGACCWCSAETRAAGQGLVH